MKDDLSELDTWINNSHIFGRMTSEKREETADAIYMSAIRSGLEIGVVIGVMRTTSALDVRFFGQTTGNIYNFIQQEYRQFAQKLFHKKAGGGTPNAAIGKAELLLLVLNNDTTKPPNGDILFNGRNIEIKVNGGKFGIGSGEAGNRAAVNWCQTNNVILRKAKTGKSAKGQFVFDPTKEEDRQLVGQHLGSVLAAWWKGVSGKTLKNPTWPEVRSEFLKIIAEENLTIPKVELLVFAANGDFRLLRDAKEFVTNYNNDNSHFEYRAYQKNPFSIYL